MCLDTQSAENKTSTGLLQDATCSCPWQTLSTGRGVMDATKGLSECGCGQRTGVEPRPPQTISVMLTCQAKVLRSFLSHGLLHPQAWVRTSVSQPASPAGAPIIPKLAIHALGAVHARASSRPCPPRRPRNSHQDGFCSTFVLLFTFESGY